jgi:aspartate aminotransferase
MTISKKIIGLIENSSWIREMFEESVSLKQRYGADNVFDFSLGNPHLNPPKEFYTSLKEELKRDKSLHGYMSNAGFWETREAISNYLSAVHRLCFCADEIIITCGAAGALNIVLKAILDPGEEVIVPSPYFVEYNFYVDNHGGIIKRVKTKKDFNLDIEAIAKELNIKTKAILLNSPNNPSGQIYPKSALKELAELLYCHKEKYNRIIYIVMDEPYRKLVYDNEELASIFQIYKEALVATSFSKDLSLAGERIGYLAINPQATYKKDLIAACIVTNRILGFVNAPALMQRVVKHILNSSVEIDIYKKNRDLLCEGLKQSGFSFLLPKGTFYVFPKTPIDDDIAFVKALQKKHILAVPGSGFGSPGHFRLAFCVEEKVIKRALPYFREVAKEFGMV